METQKIVRFSWEIPNFACFDKDLRDRNTTWAFAMVGGGHRDMTSIDASNFEVIKAELSKMDPDNLSHRYDRASHWAVGWYDHLLVDTTNHKLMQYLKDCIDRLDDYPILNEDDHSQLEFESHCDNQCYPECPFEHCTTCHDSIGEDETHCELHADESDDDSDVVTTVK
jgi:hypothetical protein